jgi:PAS domain-containing protein
MVNIAPIRNAEGALVGAINCFLDVSERHKAEENLRESQQLLQMVLTTLPVGVVVTDRAAGITLANPAFKRIWGDTIVPGRERWAQSKAFWHDSGKRIDPESWASARALLQGQTSLNELIDTRLLLDSTAEAIYGIDIHGLCTFCNSACVRLLGYAEPPFA